MAVLIRLRTNKAGANSDATFQSGKEVLKKNISLWSIPYELPATTNEDPPTEPVVIRHCFDDLPNGVEVVSYANGFVTGLIRAHHQGLHLRLRPEDVWLSILSQLRVYAYRQPNSTPGLSSSHNLNVDLSIDLETDPRTIDSTYLEEKISRLSHTLMSDDADLRHWILPNFSSTTMTDRTVASVVMMGEVRKSTEPEYDSRLRIGFSSVKLLGEKSDWEEILRRVAERVPTFGNKATEWLKFLDPVIKGIISSFDSPDLPQTKEFWGQACHFDGANLGVDRETITGWITAFCFWSDSGDCLHPDFIDGNALHHHRNPIEQPGRGDERSILWDQDRDNWTVTNLIDRKNIFIGGVKCHHILPKNIPNGTVTALTYVRDYSNRMVYSATIVAGSMGAVPTTVGYLRDETVLQPWSGWFLLEDGLKTMSPLQQHRVFKENGHEVIELD